MSTTRPVRINPVRVGLVARLRPIASREVWKATAYLLLNAGFGSIWAFLFFTLFPLGVALAYTLVGLVILALTMRLWMAGADLERARLASFFGVVIRSPYRPLPERGLMARALARAGDPAAWRDLLYLVLLFPLGLVEATLVILAWAIVLAGVAGVFYLPAYRLFSGASLPEMFDHTLRVLPMVVLTAAISLAFATVLPRFIFFLARGHVAIARTLLAPRHGREAQLAERVEELSESRSRVLEAALLERRRIERDLHDGAQQRMVAVAMGLGLARGKMETDPGAAAALVEEAHEEAMRAIRDLRDLVRGIHPAVLSDRGLDAAISALAGRSPVPVEVNVEQGHRHPEAVESAAYFVVAEALTNVAKHSDATHARVNVACEGDRLVLEVADDGSGGAHPDAGSGLIGLADRVAALDGRLYLSSPPGGPTLVRAELPCK